MKRTLIYGAIGGALIALLKVIEYQHFVRTYPSEMYGGLIAVIFTAVGGYVGLRLVRRPQRSLRPERREAESARHHRSRVRDSSSDRRRAEQPGDRGGAVRLRT